MENHLHNRYQKDGRMAGPRAPSPMESTRALMILAPRKRIKLPAGVMGHLPVRLAVMFFSWFQWGVGGLVRYLEMHELAVPVRKSTLVRF